MSWPCDLFASSLLIIFSISSGVKEIEAIELLVYRFSEAGRLLPVSKMEHCFAKNELKSSAFSLKSVMNLFSCRIGGMQGIFFIR